MFERFAEEARRATALASEEARLLGHDFIGTEHLLLGLLASGEGPASSVLGQLEVTLEDARRLVSERVHAAGSGNVDSPPFTPLAKKSLSWALREALQMRSAQIGSEHLLLGLIDVPDGGGARILEELAGSLLYVRQVVVGGVGPGVVAGEGGEGEEPLGQPKATATGGTLRRWAAQSRTVLRTPSGVTTGPWPRPAGPLGPAPRCPACHSSLATEARYRVIAVEPGAEGEGEEAAPDAVDVTVVYCGHCGVSLGIA
jgi:hypothetical protein